MTTHTILWRRLDANGHDACRLIEIEHGWRLEGATIFHHESEPTFIRYQVDSDEIWRTESSLVYGWIGTQSFEFRIMRSSNNVWMLNGKIVPEVAGCVDLDLGFTPATNLFQLRRLALVTGQSADARVAWFDLPGDTLQSLHQRYERRSVDTYWYESPQFHYSAILQVNELGFVEKYPTLWEAETWARSS
jgi:hypothetical protein